MGYEEFANYLDNVSEDSFSITFEEIEGIIGEKLPDSALQYPAWWSNNDSHPFMREVLLKNWKSRKLNLEGKRIEFYKNSQSEFERLKQFCINQFPRSVRNYREIAIKILLQKENFTVNISEITDEIKNQNSEEEEPQAGYARGSKEMIDEQLIQRHKVATKDGDMYSLLLRPENTTEEQIAELIEICDKSIGGLKQEYFLLRYNGQDRDSQVEEQWDDKLGERYHFGRRVQNQKKLRKAGSGTKTIWFKTKNLPSMYFWGFGEVKEIITHVEDEDWNLIYDDFKYFEKNEDSVEEEGVSLKQVSESIMQQIESLPGYNSQISMIKITKEIYEQITGTRSVMSTSTNQDSFVDDRTIEILKRKKNIILYGPPGTGKTFTAKKIAEQLTENQMLDTQKIWLWPVTPENWKVVLDKDLWGSNDEISKLKENISENDLVVFYVNTTNEIRGIYQFSGEWYRAEKNIWKGEQTVGNDIKIKRICLGHVDVRDLHDKLDLFEGATSLNAVNARLQSKGKIIRGPAAELTRRDFKIISEKMKIRIVTFHQSYGYEEFVEGIRPKAIKNVITYPIEPGIFRKICNDAKDSDSKFVLIIDEINRGNISKIFGELITIIENDKRGTEITLAYSSKQFNVPENIYIIGTMNTADQSLTHIDAALKRRFSSIEVMPDSSILTNGMRGLAELLDKINEKVREKRSRDNQIGHSYFMQDGKPITEIKELQLVFATDIIPLLRDYFYDSEDDLKDVLGEQFIDWDEGSDRTVKEDWQNNAETFRATIKEAYNVTI